MLGRLLEKEIALNNIAAGAAGQKLVVKHADQKEARKPGQVEADLLDAEQNLPPDRGRDFDHHISEYRSAYPAIIRGSQRDFHLLALIGVVKDVPKEQRRDRQLND